MKSARCWAMEGDGAKKMSNAGGVNIYLEHKICMANIVEE